MTKSIFKGHQILDSDLEKLIEPTQINKFFQNPQNLANFGITDWEQLYSLIINDSLKENVKTAFGLKNAKDLIEIKKKCESVLPKNIVKNIKEVKIDEYSLGARKPNQINDITEKFRIFERTTNEAFIETSTKLSKLSKFEDDFTLASSINHVHELGQIRHQGFQRNTCVAFAVTAANEFSFFKNKKVLVNLSEQHLFYETKIYENDSFCGAYIKSAMTVISQKGQCLEGNWSYNPHPPCIQHNGKPSNADQVALSYRNTFFEINPKNIKALKQVLSSGGIIPFSIPIFKSWRLSADCQNTGRITMPLPGEEEIGAHAMVLVGYQDNEKAPGGGYFIIRNSWGSGWAKNCYYGPGYGIIPYLFIFEYAYEACAF